MGTGDDYQRPVHGRGNRILGSRSLSAGPQRKRTVHIGPGSFRDEARKLMQLYSVIRAGRYLIFVWNDTKPFRVEICLN